MLLLRRRLRRRIVGCFRKLLGVGWGIEEVHLRRTGTSWRRRRGWLGWRNWGVVSFAAGGAVALDLKKGRRSLAGTFAGRNWLSRELLSRKEKVRSYCSKASPQTNLVRTLGLGAGMYSTVACTQDLEVLELQRRRLDDSALLWAVLLLAMDRVSVSYLAVFDVDRRASIRSVC